jgi:hypothetical protein
MCWMRTQNIVADDDTRLARKNVRDTHVCGVQVIPESNRLVRACEDLVVSREPRRRASYIHAGLRLNEQVNVPGKAMLQCEMQWYWG